METSAATMSEEDNRIVQSAQKPQDRINKIDPDSILLALNARVSIRILIDIDLTEHGKEGNPENAVI